MEAEDKQSLVFYTKLQKQTQHKLEKERRESSEAIGFYYALHDRKKTWQVSESKRNTANNVNVIGTRRRCCRTRLNLRSKRRRRNEQRILQVLLDDLTRLLIKIQKKSL